MLASVDCFVRFMHGEAVEQKTLVILSWCSSSTYVACTSIEYVILALAQTL